MSNSMSEASHHDDCDRTTSVRLGTLLDIIGKANLDRKCQMCLNIKCRSKNPV